MSHSPAVVALARDHIERRSSSDFIERGASPLGVVTATLPLGNGPLGLHLNAANVILRISPEGKAAAEGSLKVGMRIVSVNGTSTKGTTLAAIVKASTATALELEAEDSAERRLSIERRASFGSEAPPTPTTPAPPAVEEPPPPSVATALAAGEAAAADAAESWVPAAVTTAAADLQEQALAAGRDLTNDEALKAALAETQALAAARLSSPMGKIISTPVASAAAALQEQTMALLGKAQALQASDAPSGASDALQKALDEAAGSDEAEKLRNEGARVLGELGKSEAAQSVFGAVGGLVEERAAGAAAGGANAIGDIAARVRGAVESGALGGVVESGAALLAKTTRGAEKETGAALGTILDGASSLAARANAALEGGSPPAARVKLAVNDDGLVRAEITAEAAADGAGGVSEALLSRLQWAQEQKLGQYALAQGAKALEGLDAASLEELVSGGKQAMVDPEKRADLLSKAKDALLAFFVSYLPQVEVPPISGIKENVAYELDGVDLSNLKVPAEQLSLRIDGGTALVLEAKGVSFDLRGVRWKVRHQSWRAMSGEGELSAASHSTELRVSFRLAAAETLAQVAAGGAIDEGTWAVDEGKAHEAVASLREAKPELAMDPPFIKLHHLELKIANSWLATRLIALFSDTVKARIEAALVGALVDNTAGMVDKLNALGKEYWPVLLDSAEQYVGTTARAIENGREILNSEEYSNLAAATEKAVRSTPSPTAGSGTGSRPASAAGATTTAGASGSPIGAKAAAKLPDFSGLPPHLRPVTDAANSSA